jgi:putative ABC transport system substrate-binding protein
MIKKFVDLTLSTLLLALTYPVEAQQQAKVPRIGWLAVRPDDLTAGVALFLRELRALGYVEDKNFTLEYRSAENKLDRLPALADELVRLKVDIIVAAGGINVIRAAKNATKTIPIVMGGSGIDPVVAGLVESLARPGSNVTGITNLSRELGGKRLD